MLYTTSNDGTAAESYDRDAGRAVNKNTRRAFTRAAVGPVHGGKTQLFQSVRRRGNAGSGTLKLYVLFPRLPSVATARRPFLGVRVVRFAMGGPVNAASGHRCRARCCGCANHQPSTNMQRYPPRRQQPRLLIAAFHRQRRGVASVRRLMIVAWTD
jgi:hypothetical protein